MIEISLHELIIEAHHSWGYHCYHPNHCELNHYHHHDIDHHHSHNFDHHQLHNLNHHHPHNFNPHNVSSGFARRQHQLLLMCGQTISLSGQFAG